MARLKTRSISADRHRRAHIQPPSGYNSTAHEVSEKSGENSSEEQLREEQPRPDNAIPTFELKTDVPSVENADSKPISDLALDLVLNEIVLQARLTTNATGAVIALEKSHKLICRATTGATSSEIAAFLNIPSGISATCFETGAVRRIDDVTPSSHADATAYQRASVRSILVVPISNDEDQVLGVLQSFSPRPNAFCDRDVLTMQALARRIATNIELVEKSYRVDANKVTGPLRQQSQITTPRPVPRPSRLQFRAPQFFSALLTKRWKIAPANWSSVFGKTMPGKTALLLVLLAAGFIASGFWIQNRDLRRPAVTHQPSQVLVQKTAIQTANVVASNVPPPEINPTNAKPIISTPAPSRQQVPKSQIRSPKHHTTSVTIERKPLRNGPTSVVSDRKTADKTPPSSNEIVLFEDQESSSQKPAIKTVSESVSPGAANPSVESISTQAALARLVQRVEPEYPNAARQQHIQGDVLLDMLVNENGAVVELALVSGAPQLMPAAEQAVRQWHFQPLTKAGHAQQFKSRVGINFTLAAEGSSQTR
jgi:protein TonB